MATLVRSDHARFLRKQAPSSEDRTRQMTKTMRLFAAACACALSPAFAQSVQWAASVMGPGNRAAVLGDGDYVTRMMAVDASGNVFVAGTFSDGTSKNWVVTKLAA